MIAQWKKYGLANLCEVFADGDWIESKDQSDEGIRLIQTGNIGQGSFKDRGEKARYISEETFKRLRCSEVFEGDCLVSRLSDPAGRSCILPNTGERMLTAVDCTIIRFDKNKVTPEFFCYYSQSSEYLSAVALEATGTTRKRISRNKLGQTPVPLPPLVEQQRIVRILDQAFDSIATAKANAEKNLQNARALFESHLHAVFDVALTAYEQVPLSDLATDITDGDHMPPPKSATGVPFITISNIDKRMRKIDFSDTFMVPRDYVDGLKLNRKPKRGDVLYTVTGSFGIPVLIKDDVEFCFQRHIGLVRPKPSTDSGWLSYLLMSPQIFKQAVDGATGTAQKTVSLKTLRSLGAPRVPLSEQQSTALKLDRLQIETQRLESLYQQKLAALDELKKSLLHQAFSGAL